MSWFRKPKQKLSAGERRDMPSDVFDKCPRCGEILYRARLEQNMFVCPACGYHNRISAEDYIRLLLDDEYREHSADLRSGDPLDFVDLKPYPQRLEAAERKAGGGDAVRAVSGELDAIPVCLADMSKPDATVPIDDERRRIGSLPGRLPAQAVGVRKRIIRIDDVVKIRRPILVREKLLRMRLQLIRRTGIHHEHLDVLRGEFGRLRHVVIHLARTDRTLGTNPTAEDDEHHGTFRGQGFQFHGFVVERAQREVRRRVPDLRRRGGTEDRKRRKHEARGERGDERTSRGEMGDEASFHGWKLLWKTRLEGKTHALGKPLAPRLLLPPTAR